MTTSFPPTPTPPALCQHHLREHGYAVLDRVGVGTALHLPLSELDAIRPSWQHLPPDTYLRDGGRYRRRRHACFCVDGAAVQLMPHRAHWQPLEYNALHGGLERWFEPIEASTLAPPAWNRLLVGLAGVASELKGAQPWFVEAHQFRIDTSDGIGRPTPEGAHRDGVDLVAVMLIERRGVKGGETRVFDAHGSSGQRFTMTEPWTTLLLDDERVIHETTPIQPLDGQGWRDTLVVTCRRGGFQGPPGP